MIFNTPRIILYFLVVCVTLLYTQSSEEQPAQKIIELSDLALRYSATNADSGLLLARQALYLAEQSGNRKNEILPLYRLGQLHRIKGEFKNSGKFLHEAFELSKAFGDSTLMLGILNDLSRFYFESSPDNALQFQLSALEIARKKNDSVNIGGIYNNIGNIFLYQKKYDSALEHFFISKKVWDKVDPKNIAGIYSDIGNIYYRKNRYDSALYYYYKSLAASNYKNDKFGMGYALNNIGLVYIKQKLYQKSLDALTQSMELRKEVGSYEGMENSLFNLSQAYEAMGNISKALEIALQLFELAQQRDSKLILMHAHDRLQTLYAQLHDYKNAYYHHTRALHYADSIQTIEKNRHYAQLEVLYEIDKQQLENSYLREQQEKQTALLRQQRILIIVAGVFFIFAVIAIFILYNSNKEKQRANEQLLEQKAIIELQKIELENINAVKDKLFSVLSHDLVLPIASMQAMITSLKEKIPVELGLREEILRSLATSNYIVLLLENILHWSKNQWKEFKVEPTVININEIVHNESLLFQTQIMLKRLHVENAVHITQTAFADLTMITIVIRNLLSNAIKFTPDGGFITVSARSLEGAVEVSISDSGVGIPQHILENLFQLSNHTERISDQRGLGLGLILCKEYVEKNGGALSVQSSEKGTTFSFTIPSAI